MDRIFNMDNKFFTFMGRLADLVILNLLCIVCCIPIVTAGASITAMYYVTLKMVRNEEAYIIRGFFHSFKQNLKQSLIIHLIMLFAGIMLAADIYIVNQIGGGAYKVLLYVQVLQQHQEYICKRIFNVTSSSAVYISHACDLCTACSNAFYSQCQNAVHDDHAVLPDGFCSPCLCQILFLREDF